MSRVRLVLQLCVVTTSTLASKTFTLHTFFPFRRHSWDALPPLTHRSSHVPLYWTSCTAIVMHDAVPKACSIARACSSKSSSSDASSTFLISLCAISPMLTAFTYLTLKYCIGTSCLRLGTAAQPAMISGLLPTRRWCPAHPSPGCTQPSPASVQKVMIHRCCCLHHDV